LEKDDCPASFWHDVPLYPTINGTTNDQIINFVVEIPRWTDGKIEIKRDEPFSELRSGFPCFLSLLS
jgi:inorganic pyrophosphatase